MVLSDEWRIMIHAALQNAFSVNRRHDRANRDNSKADLKVGDIINVEVIRIVTNYAIVTVGIGAEKYAGSIHISQLSEQFIESVKEVVSVGDICKARVLGYDEIHNKWKFTLKKGKLTCLYCLKAFNLYQHRCIFEIEGKRFI